MDFQNCGTIRSEVATNSGSAEIIQIVGMRGQLLPKIRLVSVSVDHIRPSLAYLMFMFAFALKHLPMFLSATLFP